MKQSLAMMLVFCLVYSAGNLQAKDDRLVVVASHPILADVVRQVTGDVADVSSLMPLNSDPHTFSPTPNDVVRLADAGVIFINGAGFEESLLETIKGAGDELLIVTASQCVNILPFGDDHSAEHGGSHKYYDPCRAHDEALLPYFTRPPVEGLGKLVEIDCGEGEAQDDHENEEHSRAEGRCDPHVWTDPRNVMYWVLTIRDTLIQLDPDHAAIYTANATAYLDQLARLDQELETIVATLPAEKRILVTDHAAFSYFAQAYGFEVVGTVIPGISTAAEPSAAELANLIDVIDQMGVSTIFVETTANTDLAEQIAEETDTQIQELYGGTLSDGEPAGTYLDYMRYNTQTIVRGLSQ